MSKKLKKLRSIIFLKKLVTSNKTLIFILFIGTFFRLVGFMPGYPPYHSDEGMSYASAINMIKNFNLDPGRYDYPVLIPLIHAFLYLFMIPFALIYNFIFSAETLPVFKNIFELIANFIVKNQQTMIIFWGRFITGLFGIGIVFLIYFLSQKLLNDKRVSLGVAFLTAVNFRQVLNSHLGLPDIYNSFFLILSLIFSINLYKNPNLKNYLLAVFGIGFSFSIKFQIFALFPFLLLHLWIGVKNSKSLKEILLKLFSKNVLLSGIITAIFVTLIHIFYLIHWKEFKEINSYNLLKYTFGVSNFNYYALSYLYHIGIGDLIFIFIILGLIISFIKNFFQTLFLLLAIIPFLYVFLYYSGGGIYTRNFVTVTPLLLIFASVFIVRYWDFSIKKGSVLKAIFIFLTLIFVSWSNIINSIQVITSYIKPWSFQKAQEFVYLYIPDKAKVISHPRDLYPRDKELQITPFESNMIFNISEMREEGVEYGFLNLNWLTIKSNWWMSRRPKKTWDFWNKPNLYLSNTNSAAVSQEIAAYTIAPFIKPWQAPEMNILIIKIPKEVQINEKILLKEYTLDNASEIEKWHLVDQEIEDPDRLFFDQAEGYANKGSLKLNNQVGLFQSQRTVSEVIPIKENKAYLFEGWIKSSDQLEKEERDGMIRVDFYRDDPGFVNTQSSHLYSAASSRYFGSNWKKINLTVIAPKNARFLTLNLEHIGNSEFFWFDDLRIYESIESFEDPKTKAPYIDYKIPVDILFPYSQGGL